MLEFCSDMHLTQDDAFYVKTLQMALSFITLDLLNLKIIRFFKFYA